MARVMKDSGIEWIGEIPDSWQLLRMKSCIEQRDGGAWGEEATGEEGDTICLRIADFDYARFRFKDTEESELTTRHYDLDVVQKLLLEKNDILIEKSGGGEKTPVGRTVLFDKAYPALFANFMDRLRCTFFVHPPFMQYIFVTFYKNDYTRNYIKQTTGIQNLDLTSMLANEKVAMPSISEQHRIADFLDRRCAEIDAVIERTKATIEEYKKLKQAVITEAVTKGVRGARKMKDSGIEWIGEICDTYCVYRLKHLVSEALMYGANESGIPFEDNLPRYIRITDITLDGHLKDEGKLSLPEEAAAPYILKHNDILFARSGATVGKAFIYKQEYGRAAFAGYLIKASTNELVCADYVFYYTQSSLYEEWKKQIFVQATIQNIGADRYNNLPVVLPDVDEQHEIIAYLDEKCAVLDTLIVKKTALLTELETYKKSLIYECVTGKKEVQ